MEPIREKKHRLPEAAYYGRKAVSFTACIDGRKPVFTNADVVAANRDLLQRALRKFDTCGVYCFMPDHLHLIALGLSDAARSKLAMEDFKQASGYRLAQHGLPGWQKSFHDHICRKDEDLRGHTLYVLQNPVRSGLVTAVADYAFSGAIDLDIDTFLWDLDT